MAKSLLEINMNYIRAVKDAEALEEIARSLDKAAVQELAGNLSRIRANWKGENAEAYLRKGEKLKGQIEDNARDIRTTAKVILSIADRTRAAELNAREIAMST